MIWNIIILLRFFSHDFTPFKRSAHFLILFLTIYHGITKAEPLVFADSFRLLRYRDFRSCGFIRILLRFLIANFWRPRIDRILLQIFSLLKGLMWLLNILNKTFIFIIVPSSHWILPFKSCGVLIYLYATSCIFDEDLEVIFEKLSNQFLGKV